MKQNQMATAPTHKQGFGALKIKLNKEGSQLYEKIVQLKMKAFDGKMRETDTI